VKIPKIEISNVLALHRADIEITTPVLMVLGNNEAGKSSLRDAISMALLGDPSRLKVKNKKDLVQLMHEGEKKGRVSLLDGEDLIGEYKLPGGEHSAPTIKGAEYLQHVINPAMTASLPDKELRTMLFQLTRCKASPEITAGLLLKRGARPGLVDEVKPMLRAGFPAASKDAAERATQAKGSFRELTGDNWGSVQSEGWEQVIPDAPGMEDVSSEAIDEVIASHGKVTAEIEKGVGYIAGLEAKIEQAANFYTRRDELTEAFELLERAKTKLATDEATLAELEEQFGVTKQQLTDMQAGVVPVACPCCNELLRINGQTLEPFAGIKADTKATSDLALQVTKARGAIDMLKRTISNDIAAVTTAENAGKDLAALEAQGCPEVKDGAMQKAQDKLTECRLLADKLRAKVEAMKQRQELIDGAEETTAKAKQHHEDVLAWDLIAKALAPDGIPAEILGTALKPVNDSLAILSRLSGWKKVQISTDMEITADGRIYGLMSESAKWRIDTLLALMIAQISELKFVVLDRFDVLDMEGRGQLINMLLDLADMGSIEQAIICGTLKAPLSGMPDEVGQVWVENGQAANV
jgi:hypothetical protein